ncbi:MAG TPA: tetratricopeptide repeat protein [Candidatus Acidoferrales bacterium]|nr:tetratricopeptide repeat protein [Candidatus Acidoferrales bacterium]
MKRFILTGILAMAAGASALMAQNAAPKGPAPKSKAELEALQGLFQAQQQGNPDGVIKAADDLIAKFADTDFKDTVLYMEAEAYEQKHDNAKAQVYAEQALKANPKSYQANIMLAELVAQGTRENDLDKNEKLTQSAKYANDAIALSKDAPKPNPQITDAQWDEFKKSIVARAHNAFGMAALVNKKYDVAAAEFKTAAENDPQPAFLVREASALQSEGKNDEAIALCDKIAGDPQAHPQVKQVAQQIKAAAVKAKGTPQQ